jgi:hypothetical protein
MVGSVEALPSPVRADAPDDQVCPGSPSQAVSATTTDAKAAVLLRPET